PGGGDAGQSGTSAPSRRRRTVSGGVGLEGVLGGALQEHLGVLAGDGAGDRDLGGQRIDRLLEQVALGEARRGAARVAHDRADDLDAVAETPDRKSTRLNS